MKKRVLSLLLVLVLAVTMIPAAGAANRNSDAPAATYPVVDFMFSFEDFLVHRQLGSTVTLRVGYFASNLPSDAYWAMAFFKGSIEDLMEEDAGDYDIILKDHVPLLLSTPKPLTQNGYNELSYAWNTSGLKAGVYTALILGVDKNGSPLDGAYNADYTVITLDAKAKHITGACWLDSYGDYTVGSLPELTGPAYIAKGKFYDAPLAFPKPLDATDQWTAAYSTTTPDIIRVGKEYGTAVVEGLNYGIGSLVGKVAGYTITMDVEVCKYDFGHVYNASIHSPATETSYGSARFTCKHCGYSYEDKYYHSCHSEGYTDVPKPGTWAHLPIDYVIGSGLMTGTTTTTFAPKKAMNRAQLVTTLYRLAGSPKVSGTTPFTDLTGNYYKDAVLWAYQTGLVKGVSDTRFDPNTAVNREMFATVLYRYYTQYRHLTPVAGAKLSQFSDAGSVSSYAKTAIAWAVAMELVTGSGGKLMPKDTATREQAAALLTRFCQVPGI